MQNTGEEGMEVKITSDTPRALAIARGIVLPNSLR